MQKPNPDLPLSKALAVEKQDQAIVKNATRMMGHLSFAAQAIDLKMKKSAIDNLTSARKLSNKIMASRPAVIAKYKVRFGKMSYTVDGLRRNYYVPVADDLFVEGSFDEKSIWKKSPEIEGNGIAIVHSNLQINLRDVDTAIDSTKELISKGKFEEARNKMDAIFKDSILGEEMVSNPVWTVWANLELAKEFLTGNQFKGARYTLRAARADLDRLEKNGILSKGGDEAKALKTELSDVEKTLDDKNPSLIKKLQVRLTGWISKVRTWM